MWESALFVLREKPPVRGEGTYRIAERTRFRPWRRLSQVCEAVSFLIENLTELAGAAAPARAAIRVDSRDARTLRRDRRGV